MFDGGIIINVNCLPFSAYVNFKNHDQALYAKKALDGK
jgi:hypothetical protein